MPEMLVEKGGLDTRCCVAAPGYEQVVGSKGCLMECSCGCDFVVRSWNVPFGGLGCSCMDALCDVDDVG